MKQAIIRKGSIFADDVPPPRISAGSVLIKNVSSCISAGTEVSSLQTSAEPLVKKALQQPAELRKVFNMARSEGYLKTAKRVLRILDTGKPVGYSASGIVIGVGEGVKEFRAGDRVAAAGAGYANHAEFVDVPSSLVVHLPKNLGFDDASTVALGAIAMHGIRRAQLTLGEMAVVYGTGIIGLLTVQLLCRAGVRVIAIDLDAERLKLAGQFGAEKVIRAGVENSVEKVFSLTSGRGADAVLFTASTNQSGPLSQAFKMCRRKGKVVLVGVAGMTIDRNDIYPNEIDFLVSTSYGPGRYDRSYEEKGLDYPFAYVRWTERRNMEEYLRLLSRSELSVQPMISQTFPIERVGDAFGTLTRQRNKSLLVILQYGMPTALDVDLPKSTESKFAVVRDLRRSAESLGVGLIGAGSFATSVHLPNIIKHPNRFTLEGIVDNDGAKGKAAAKAFSARYVSNSVEDLLSDDAINAVFICTRHGDHANLALRALKAGKHVFVEKPLAVSHEQLDSIKNFYSPEKGKPLPVLMTGFNRRFSPHMRSLRQAISNRTGPFVAHYRMNAGYIPPDHWVHEDGGRIVGEACHIIDAMTYLAGAPVEEASALPIGTSESQYVPSDNRIITLRFADGSVCSIHYFSVGNRSIAKENLELHVDGMSYIMNDYKTISVNGKEDARHSTKKSEKGHEEEILAFADTIQGKTDSWPIPLEEMIRTTFLSLRLA